VKLEIETGAVPAGKITYRPVVDLQRPAPSGAFDNLTTRSDRATGRILLD
jgi:hypothetical protein